MSRVRKSTMIEFVTELETLLNSLSEGQTGKAFGLSMMIEEAKAGEYHDYKNEKYVCGKVAASSHLRNMGFIDLAKRIEDGEFDEEADEQDKEMLRKTLADNGMDGDGFKKLFGL